MNNVKKITGLALAAAAAAMFMAAPAANAAKHEGKVHCTGVNACKGQGFISMSEKDCKAKGGKIEK